MPIPVSLPTPAAPRIASAIPAGLTWPAWSSSAATPATCGAAMEVPEEIRDAVLVVWPALVMDEPGAKRSTQVP